MNTTTNKKGTLNSYLTQIYSYRNNIDMLFGIIWNIIGKKLKPNIPKLVQSNKHQLFSTSNEY